MMFPACYMGEKMLLLQDYFTFLQNDYEVVF